MLIFGRKLFYLIGVCQNIVVVAVILLGTILFEFVRALQRLLLLWLKLLFIQKLFCAARIC